MRRMNKNNKALLTPIKNIFQKNYYFCIQKIISIRISSHKSCYKIWFGIFSYDCGHTLGSLKSPNFLIFTNKNGASNEQ